MKRLSHPLPTDWTPDNALYLWAQQKRSDLNLKEVIEHFRDYWTAREGKGSMKKNWSATFRNWVRSTEAKGILKAEPKRYVPAASQRLLTDEQRTKNLATHLPEICRLLRIT
jgi:hypothetical protein